MRAIFSDLSANLMSNGPHTQTKLGNWVAVDDLYEGIDDKQSFANTLQLLNSGGEAFMDTFIRDLAGGTMNEKVLAIYKADPKTKEHLAKLNPALSILVNDYYRMFQKCAEAARPRPTKHKSPAFGSLSYFGSS